MIARNRPESRFHEIVRACLPTSRQRKEELCEELAQSLLRALDLEGQAVLVPSGRAALYLLFRAIPLKRVYLPAYTCWVVLEAARLAGKEVEFLDIRYPSLNLRAECLERIRDRPGIVVATHQFGYPEDVAGVLDCLSGKEHVVIEDCAGAMFCSLRSSPLGGLAAASAFSFETGKLLTLGGGGMVATRDGALAKRIQDELADLPLTRSHALRRLLMRRVSTAPVIYRFLLALYLLLREPTEGFHQASARLTREYCEDFAASQARLGAMLMARISEIAQRRRELFERYDEAIPSLRRMTRVESLPDSRIAPIRYPFLVPQHEKRAIYDSIRARGIDLGFSYSYSLASPADCPDAARFGAEVLNLPLYADLSVAHAERVVAALREASK
jgi:dTDP-4-amino-4,6-dideoxygalactose transaminase